MNIKFFKLALGIAFTAIAVNASAQKTYTEGTADFSLKTQAGEAESKVSFRGDSSVAVTQQGPALIKLIANKDNYFAVLVDVPMASIKKAAVLTPDELDQAMAAAPKFTFTPTTETKQINGFNCKKVIAKDAKSGTNYDTWVTTDISAPLNSVTKLFADAGGFPVQFTTLQQGHAVDVTLKSITAEKVPAGTFGIPAGFDRISLDDLKAMGGGR